MLLLIIIMIIMNMQNKLYTIQFFSPPDDRWSASPRAAIMELGKHEFLEISKRFQTPRQERIQTHRNNKAQKIPAPRPTPIHKLSMMSMVRNISIGQLGLAVWLCSLPDSTYLLIS